MKTPLRKHNKFWTTALMCLVSALCTATLYATSHPMNPVTTRLYVDQSVGTSGNGLSWATAYQELRDALNAAHANNTITEIWVAQGTYKPTDDLDRLQSFVMKNNLAIYGGFIGNETALNQRDFVANPTTLSGDLADDDDYSQVPALNNEDNAYHVIFNYYNYLDETAIIDGFHIVGGNAKWDPPHHVGGGLYNKQSSPAVYNCFFHGNRGGYGGGGIYIDSSALILRNSVIFDNTGVFRGGGMYNDASVFEITNCLFYNNKATGAKGIGGGIFNNFSNPVITNCTFAKNTAVFQGGGILNNGFSKPDIYNSIFWENGDEIVNTSSFPNDYSPTSPITNNIVQIQNCLIQNSGGSGATWNAFFGIDEGNNLSLNPDFVNFTENDFRLSACSPAINYGDATFLPSDVLLDMDEANRIFNLDNGGQLDLGAFEYQAISNCCNIAFPCDDNDPCTSGETFQTDCNCGGGTIIDADNDGVCDTDIADNCVGPNVGSPCNDGNANTFDDVVQNDCSCLGTPDNPNVCVPQVNLGLGKSATQSSTFSSGGTANLALDGNTNGDFWNGGSTALTTWNNQSWWQVDLGEVYNIEQINIFNRTDCCSDFLKNYHILISADPFVSTDLSATLNQASVIDFFQTTVAESPTSVVINQSGRYLRIQLAEQGFMGLAEVEIMGCTTGGNSGCPDAGTPCDDNDPNTENDVEDGDCNCEGTPVVPPCPDAGTPCDDNDPNTENDVEDGDCNCEGTPVVPPCPDAGTPCDDNDPNTDNDVEDGNCNCEGTPVVPSCPDAGTPCDDNDPDTENDVEDGDCNCEGTPIILGSGNCTDSYNIALTSIATQSSVVFGADANRAIDGNTAGHFWDDASTALTSWENQPWLTLDLGQVANIESIQLWARTECCSEFLSNYYILISNNPFTTTNLDATLNQSGVSSFFQPTEALTPSVISINESGRYIRIQLAGQAFLGIAELEVIGCFDDGGSACPDAGTPCDDNNPNTNNDVEDGDCNCAGTPIVSTGCSTISNLALGKTTAQSSTITAGGITGNSDKAVDGNTNGIYFSTPASSSSVAATNFSTNPWWQVDLGDNYQIEKIKVFNRTDGSDKTNNAYVLVADTPFTSDDLTTARNQANFEFFVAGQAGTPSEILTETNGRYVRVQTQGSGYLVLAEVEVEGCESPANFAIPNLLYFQAEKQGYESQLTWLMNRDDHVAFYEVEKSLDGMHFEVLATVSADQVNAPRHYQATDDQPQHGKNYYRLRVETTTGEHYYSAIRQLNFDIDFGEVVLYPNPTQTWIHLALRDFVGKKGNIQIFNALGQEMLQRRYESIPTIPTSFEVKNWKAGIYAVSIQIEGQRRFSKQFVIVR
ncbi:MAG: discoidin domain-containing protein [Bacteroidota bacterium]